MQSPRPARAAAFGAASLLALLALLALIAPVSLVAQPRDSTYRDHDRAAGVARAAGDWKGYRHHAGEVARLTNGHPSTAISLARAEARLGDTAAALGHVRRFARMGMIRDLSADGDFAELRALPAWREIAAAMDASALPAGTATAGFWLPGDDFLAEDAVYDAARDRFLVSSIRHRKIVAVSRAGVATDFVASGADGLHSALALAVDAPRGLLWATAAALPHAIGYAAADSGRADLRAYDLRTGRLVHRYPVPRVGPAPVPGDMAVSAEGEVVVSDAIGGAMYVVRPGRDTLEVLVPPGVLPSPQGPAYDRRGRLFVADYALGIARVDRRTGAVAWLAHASDVALSGIDGMSFDAETLIAIQNGTAPKRILRLALDEAGTRVTAVTVLAHDPALLPEPTRGTIVGRDLWVVGGPGWDQFDDAGKVKPGVTLRAPAVVRVPLR